MKCWARIIYNEIVLAVIMELNDNSFIIDAQRYTNTVFIINYIYSKLHL